MPRQAEISYDAASAIVLGKREIQEDALAADFQVGSEFGFTVLSDGMGGHAAGAVASNIVVTEVFSELKLQSIDLERTVEGISGILSEAALSANQCLRAHTSRDPATTGMGATLVAPVLAGNKLFWISIGDSPLFLFRDNQLSQLNEDHSMAPQIDCMVKSGLISETDGRDHPDRNCLTSALLGDEIPRIDCPKEPFTLLPGDIVVAASDGLQFLSDRQIQRILSEDGGADSSIIAERLLAGIATLDDPYQDNVCFTVIKVLDHVAEEARQTSAKANRQKDALECAMPASTVDAQPPKASGSGLFAFLSRMRFFNSGLLR